MAATGARTQICNEHPKIALKNRKNRHAGFAEALNLKLEQRSPPSRKLLICGRADAMARCHPHHAGLGHEPPNDAEERATLVKEPLLPVLLVVAPK